MTNRSMNFILFLLLSSSAYWQHDLEMENAVLVHLKFAVSDSPLKLLEEDIFLTLRNLPNVAILGS